MNIHLRSELSLLGYTSEQDMTGDNFFGILLT